MQDPGQENEPEQQDETGPKVEQPYEKGPDTGLEEPEIGPTVPDEPTDTDTTPPDLDPKPQIDPFTGEPLGDVN